MWPEVVLVDNLTDIAGTSIVMLPACYPRSGRGSAPAMLVGRPVCRVAVGPVYLGEQRDPCVHVGGVTWTNPSQVESTARLSLARTLWIAAADSGNRTGR
jgi:hypothetical protein